MAEPAYTLDPDLEPDISHLVTEDDEPVDSIFSEKQERLLTECLYASWKPAGGRQFIALSNVGLFFNLKEPPVVPDVMVSLDVRMPEDVHEKKNRSYLVWERGKPPDVAIEIVSNRVGGEEEKLRTYAAIGVAYAVIFDPEGHLSDRPLRAWQRHGTSYVELLDAGWLPDLGLGLVLWDGFYEDYVTTWLRWCDREGALIATGTERATTAESQAEASARQAEESARDAASAVSRVEEAEREADRARSELQTANRQADAERSRADRLAARLRELGIQE